MFFVAAQAFKSDNAVNQREQCIVTAAFDVGAGMDLGASLADQNVTG